MEAFIGFVTFAALIAIVVLKTKEVRNQKVKARTQALQAPSPTLHCMVCGTDMALPEGPQRGNLAIEVVLYLFWIFPGVIYSIWRRAGSGKRECLACGAASLVPIDSPAAKAHRTALGTKP